ncbi:unnamed protein product [Caenorhabditis nigoni]
MTTDSTFGAGASRRMSSGSLALEPVSEYFRHLASNYYCLWFWSGRSSMVDSSPDKAGAPVVNGSTGDSKESHESHPQNPSDTFSRNDPDIGMQEKQEFKKGWAHTWRDVAKIGFFSISQTNFMCGWAPTEIVWSSGTIYNGYNGGIRRPEYRNLFAQRHLMIII